MASFLARNRKKTYFVPKNQLTNLARNAKFGFQSIANGGYFDAIIPFTDILGLG